jgi:small conductance mechanosensitive channel
MVGLQLPADLQDAIQPQGVTGWDVAVAVALVLLAVPTSRLVDHLTRRVVGRAPNVTTEVVHIAGRMARYAVLFAGWSLALSLVGVNVGWVATIAVVFVIMAVLIVRPLVENSAAGLLLKARPSFGEGDHIEVSGYTGEVLEISARTTVLKTPDGIRIHIPNTEVLGTILVVYTAFESRRVSIELGVDPAADLEAVSQILVDAVSGVDTVLADPAPVVLARSFGDGTINLSVRFWFGPDTHSDTAVTDQAIRALEHAMSKAGIDLPPPGLMVQAEVSQLDTEASPEGGRSNPPAS